MIDAPVQVPLKDIADGLIGKRCCCDPQLFSFVNRSLNEFGLKARVTFIKPGEEVFFMVELK